MEQTNSALVDISEIITTYLPFSRKKARRFIHLYLNPKKIGNRLYVSRAELEDLLSSNRDEFPLNV